MDPTELMKCESAAIEIAWKAGQMMANASGACRQIDEKAGFADLVTETDKAIEAFVFGELKNTFPDHAFIGEESSSQNIPWTPDVPTWIVDPIDGTTNFVHTYPSVCISIALTLNKRSLVGVIYSPFLKKLYTARLGAGSFLNGFPMRVRPCVGLREALVMTELGSQRDEERKRCVFTNLAAIGWISHGVRACGSAALDICSVAEGGADGYYEFGLHVWDMAAAILILAEAGGSAIDTEGGPLDIRCRRIICASSMPLAKEISAAMVIHLKMERD